tara:strand:+ start:409 stop:1128 length:720 start_codon:yes stop_codon:yes gene_type:complete
MLGLGHGVHGESVSLTEIFHNRYSLDFNATDGEHATLHTVAGDFTPHTKGTISMWLIMHAVSGSQNFIRATIDSNNQLFIFWHNSSDEIRFNLKAGGTLNSITYDASSFDHTAWHHIAMTWDKEENTIAAYINGSAVGEGSAYGGTFTGTLSELFLGQNSSDGAYFDGQMDEISIWTDVMDIAELYNNKVHRNVEFSGLDQSKMIAYYRMEEGTGTTIYDESTYGNNGTLVNSPTWTKY